MSDDESNDEQYSVEQCHRFTANIHPIIHNGKGHIHLTYSSPTQLRDAYTYNPNMHSYIVIYLHLISTNSHEKWTNLIYFFQGSSAKNKPRERQHNYG